MSATLAELDMQPDLASLGFIEGHRGVHTSRTMMLRELEAAMAAVGGPRNPDAIQEAIIEQNITGKSTQSGRVNTATKLAHLYSFDPDCPLFAAFEILWDHAVDSRPVLAILLALSRDAVLQATVPIILSSQPGEEVTTEAMYAVLVSGFSAKYAESTLRSASRNVMASWRLSGHLSGRKNTKRGKAPSDFVAAAYAVFIAYLRGRRGQAILRSDWAALLDFSTSEAEAALQEASRHGLLTYRRVGEVIELAPGPVLRGVSV